MYRTWYGMLERCNNPLNPAYERYGERGIKVCERWQNSFELFVLDIGEKPSKEHSIDRINNDKGYSPDNCKWATKTEQAHNRRSNKMITFRGETLNVKQWCTRLGIDAGFVYQRLKKGWDVIDALTVPRITNGQKHKPFHRSYEPVKRTSRLITYQGKTQPLAAWAKEVGVKVTTLTLRLNNQWPIHEALFTPPLPNKRRVKRILRDKL